MDSTTRVVNLTNQETSFSGGLMVPYRRSKHKRSVSHQYGNFTVEEINMKLNGIMTQGENIADNAGLLASYHAYKNSLKEKSTPELGLPGLELNNEQLFFNSYAQLWCNKMIKESLIRSVQSGVHSPGEFRVRGTIENSKEFAQLFNCPEGSPMNPDDKCGVWGR